MLIERSDPGGRIDWRITVGQLHLATIAVYLSGWQMGASKRGETTMAAAAKKAAKKTTKKKATKKKR
jgi:hypothetical protein